jgi:hypothetical protein
MKQIEASLEDFEKYMKEYEYYMSTDLSESDTRSKLVDNLLINVLGWDENDIVREKHVDSGYYDYKVTAPGIAFIVEAKRQFNELILPLHHDKTSLNVLARDNEDVLNQIRGYAIDEGVPYGVITNGYQFIISRLYNINAKSWKENIALIFKNIEDINARFIEFFNNLSKYSLINNGGFPFDLPLKPPDGKTVLSSQLDKDKELVRNSFSAVLAPLVDQVFGEMFTPEREDDAEFIKYCFIENAETKKNQNEIERLFNDKAPEIGNIIPIINTTNLALTIADEIIQEPISIKKNHPPKPIIIIGSKGAGKTTFINHLFKHRYTGNYFENQFIIYIDFRKLFEVDDNFHPNRIAKEIVESIYSKYENLDLHKLNVLVRIYRTQIKRNDENIWQYDKHHNENSYQNRLSIFLEEAQKDYLEHLTQLSLYLIRERRKRLVIIIDNADQFGDTIQEKLFVFSHSLTKSTLCGTLISLREGYFRKWQHSPPFDAYESNIYHITAPKYSEILRKRIEFAIAEVKKNQISYSIEVRSGKETKLSPSYIEYFLKGLQESIIIIENSALLDFINQTTFPNIREGLKVFKVFLNSGHTKVSEYIEREKKRNDQGAPRHIIPLHEFIKSIALQNRHYYRTDVSIVYNIFSPPLNSADHFIKLYLLYELGEILDSIAYTEKYLKSTIIIEKLTSLGYRINIINSALASLIKASLVDTDEQLSDVEWTELPEVFNIAITAKGFYYLNDLVYRFHYHDLVAQDTPIYDYNVYEKMQHSFPVSSHEGNRNLELRKEFVRIFIDYLSRMDSKQSNQVRRVYKNFVSVILHRVASEINSI